MRNFTRMIAGVANPKARARSARHSIRIVGGAWRGRRIPFPDLPELRPTPDRVRETLFNWLQPFTGGARCLDLFAGSGALGLEALSRGACEAVFVDRSAQVAASVREQLARLGAGHRASVHCEAAEDYLRATVVPFDLVFLDPPFRANALAGILPALAERAWVVAGGHLYLESERAAGAPPLPAGWRLVKSKFAGEVGYHLARRER